MDWKKFLTTEWIAFLMIFAVSTVGLFTGYFNAQEWTAASLGAGIQLVWVRWHKKKTQLQAQNGTLPKLGDDT